MGNNKTEIIKEYLNDVTQVYHYTDFEKQIDGDILLDGKLEWRFTLIVDKLKIYLDRLSDEDESIRHGIILSPLIKEIENELYSIAEFISKVGDIRVLYKRDERYHTYDDSTVAGITFTPAEVAL